MPFGLGAAAGLLEGGGSIYSALQGAKGAKDLLKAQAENNERNIAFTQLNNAQNRRYGQDLFDLSRPSQSANALGNLFYSQGEQAGNIESDRILQQVLRQNLRAGSPVSAAALTGRLGAERASTRGDRRVDATLQGIQAALPSAAALQTAGSLGRFTAPQSLPPESTPGLINANRTAAITKGGSSILTGLGNIFG